MKAEILSPSSESILRACDLISRGQVIGMPTETVYGLAGNAFDPSAVARIFETKERPTFDPLIVHVAPLTGDVIAQLDQMELIESEKLTTKAKETLSKLIDAFWPGPLTLILPKSSKVPDLVTSGLPEVGIRMPRHPVAQELLRSSKLPLAAPSANRFGRISPTSAKDVEKELGDRIEIILDGGRCEVGLESSVVKVQADGNITLLRPGGVSARDLEGCSGKTVQVLNSTSKPGVSTNSPGQLESHYAPKKPLYLLPEELSSKKLTIVSEKNLDLLRKYSTSSQAIGIMITRGDERAIGLKLEALLARKVICQSLSHFGNAAEMAQNLFATLRSLDDSEASVLFAESVTGQEGLAHAIRDRLTRAAFQSS